jgi:2,3-dihydroxybiphenyl 1,2-dioxygenase
MHEDHSVAAPRQCVTQLGYLGIGVSDLPAWKDFAANVLGLQVSGSAADGSAFLRLDGYHHRLQLFPTGEDDILFAGWEVKDADALRQIAAQVRALGTEVTEATHAEATERKVIDLIRFKDPDDLTVEVYYGPFRAAKDFVSPRGVTGFNAEELGFGHIVLGVVDPDAFLRFYMAGLGVKLTDYIYGHRNGAARNLTFTHVNPRHHSMAFVQRSVDAKRLSHFMVEVRRIDDIGVAIDVAEASGIPMRKLGRHSNDRMLSTYLRTPSGFTVEYGLGGVLIEDEANWNVRHYDVGSLWGHQWRDVDTSTLRNVDTGTSNHVPTIAAGD